MSNYVLGGSTIAAAAGIDPYRSRIELWAEMTEKMPRREAGEAAEWGLRLEPAIRQAVEERGYEVMPAPDVTLRDDTPWLVGHLDGYVGAVPIDIPDYPTRTRGVLEVKTCGPYVKGWEDDGVPIPYVAQVSAYMYLADLEWSLLACLVGGQRLELRAVERDDGLIAMLLEAGEEFIIHCRNNEPPAPDGSKATAEVLKRLYPTAHKGVSVKLTAAEMEQVRELRKERKALKEREAGVRELENLIKYRLGDAERGEFEGKVEVRYPTIIAEVKATEAHTREYRRLTV